MKKVVPFTKTIPFKTKIAEVTDITVKHTLTLKDEYEVEGDILVDGKYKMTDASQIEEEFHYKLPFVIAIDSKYDTSNLEISISDFYFEIIDEQELKINVEIDLDAIEEKELVRNDALEIPFETNESVEKLEVEATPLENLEKEIKEDLPKEEINIAGTDYNKSTETKTNIGSIFSNLTSNEETFSTYHVYIVRESDTLESIMDKYNINRDLLSDYNDLDNISIGTKLIIPCSND